MSWESATWLSFRVSTVVSGRDITGITQTGSSKIGAFALPKLQALLDAPQPQLFSACLISPTRLVMPLFLVLDQLIVCWGFTCIMQGTRKSNCWTVWSFGGVAFESSVQWWVITIKCCLSMYYLEYGAFLKLRSVDVASVLEWPLNTKLNFAGW